MKKFVFVAIGAFALFFLSGCVENSQKYKALKAELDTLNVVYANQNQEMESLFADLNDISAGMQSIREAENLLAVRSGEVSGNKSKEQIRVLKEDIKAISSAINSYKEQIAKLDSRNKRQSAEFKKLIAGLNEELEQRTVKINEITQELAAKNKELAMKDQQIGDLNQNVDALNKETANQKETITQQDQTLHLVNYLIGSRKELKEAKVISRQGIFCPPIVSSQIQNANFKSMDMREMKSIPLNSKKAKILSVHPADSYTLEEGADGMLTLKINDENSFWKQTQYLVVMVG